MKALSLLQPWASLMAYGLKRVETRSWPYRGPLPLTLAIHASKKPPARDDLHTLANGRDGVHWRMALESLGGTEGGIGDAAELAFGDYTAGRWAWLFQDSVRALPKPVPCRGMLGIWSVPADVLAKVEGQLR